MTPKGDREDKSQKGANGKQTHNKRWSTNRPTIRGKEGMGPHKETEKANWHTRKLDKANWPTRENENWLNRDIRGK